MKFTPEVIAALAVLRQAAENDFERHRIDVLEHDLTAPPTVEIIDDTHQCFNGLKFHQAKDGHFVFHTQPIHRAIWRYYYGEIPDGYQIHHVDGNPANNDIENLQALTAQAHQAIHSPLRHDHRPQASFICTECGKTYSAIDCGRNKFCSPQCRNKYRQKHDLDNRVCPQCGKEFETYKANSARFCSHACSMDAKRKHLPVKLTCPICGKAFLTDTRRCQKFCSRSCAAKGRIRRHCS